MLVRLRLIGGRVASPQLAALAAAAEEYGDGRIHPTARANLQVRGLPGTGGRLDGEALAALEATGLVPTRTHELIRNVMVSPQTGLAGGRADLRRVAADLDRRLCAQPALASLPGRFLFVLDDGRGDLHTRSCDLGLVVLDERLGQIRAGSGWGEVVALDDAARTLAALAGEFLDVRGSGATAAWHVTELGVPLTEPRPADRRMPASLPPLPYGPVAGGTHVPVDDAGLNRDAVAHLTGAAPYVVITPWRGVLIPEDPDA